MVQAFAVLPMLWTIHPVVLPGNSTDLHSLPKECGRRHNHSSQEDPGGIGCACQHSTQVQDHQEESQGREIKLSETGVRNPLPLIWVDLLHCVIPLRIVHHFPNVTNREAMDESEAGEAKGKVGPEAALLNVSENPTPVVAIKISAAQQEDASANGVKALGHVSGHWWLWAAAQRMEQTGQGIDGPAHGRVETHLVVLIHILHLLQA